MNPVPFSWMLIAIGVAFGSGNLMGGTFVYKWWGYSTLKSENARLKADNKRFRDQLGFSQEIDDENVKVEIANEDILEAINRRAPKLIVQRGWFRRAVCPSVVAAPDLACVDADGMRAIGQLK